MSTKHPIQPLALDDHGTLRFKKNKIVDFLAEGKLNELAVMDFSKEDWQQLAQLIGYSLGGYSVLSYVDDDNYNAAVKMSEGLSEDKARIAALEEELSNLRQTMREPMARLFGVHPDDLKKNG